MGLYPVTCPSCNGLHTWYSGDLDQRCDNCKNKKDDNMTNDQELINALKSTISAKDDLITHLKAEIERLKLSQLYIGPQTNNPPLAIPPNQPYIYTPYTPNPQWSPPYIITSGGTTTIYDDKGNIIGGRTTLPPQEGITVTNTVTGITAPLSSCV